MNINNMSRKDFDALPWRKKWSSPVVCQSLIILPLRTKHDSGFRCMDFVAVNKKGEPICRLSGSSDVIHIEGLGGYGYDWLNKYGTVPYNTPTVAWSIDCLSKSGLLRIWPRDKTIICGEALSSFSIYSDCKESE